MTESWSSRRAGLKVTYIGQAEIKGSGIAGTARISDLVRIFNRLGIKVDLICYGFYSDRFEIERERINNLLCVVTIRVPQRVPNFLKALCVLPMIIFGMASSKRSDIVFSDLSAVIASMPATVISEVSRKPLILDYIDVGSANFIDTMLKLNYAKRADLVFAISHYLQEKAVRELGLRRVAYLPIFLDANRFRFNPEAREHLRKDLGILEDDFAVGYGGSFWKIEGLRTLLEAAVIMKSKPYRTKVFIIGKSLWRNQEDDIPDLIRQLNLEEVVALVPSQPREKMPDFLSAFDVLCSPKIDCPINRAANPIKVVEYLSMSIPTVVSSVGEVTSFVQDGVNGFLCRPGDSMHLAEKLNWIHENYAEAMTAAEKGRRTVENDYSYDAATRQIDNVLSELMIK
jgi:glycosyltransferase involved in cell wall biosynthesis